MTEATEKAKKHKRWIWQLPFLVFLIAGTIIIIRSQNSAPYRHNSGMAFGTIYNITYQCDSDLHSSIKAELARVDASLSTFNKQSVISKINRNEDIEVDAYFKYVFEKAMQVAEQTGGAFDITVAPLVNAWGFGFKSGNHPRPATIDSLMRFTGYSKVRLEGNRVVKQDPGIMLDCNAIAKGYGSDAVARLLKSKGVANFMVEIGGEIVTKGISSMRVPWKIGVVKPVDDSTGTADEIETIINVTDKAMATSGNYRNFYYKDGKKYAHTIDPATGYPVQHNILSATVLAKECATADAYATAFMVMGIDKARQVLEKHPELMAYLIYADKDGENAIWYSPSMRDKIKPMRNKTKQ